MHNDWRTPLAKRKALPPPDWLKPRVRLMHSLTLFNFIALISLLAIWTLCFTDLHGAHSWIILGIQLIPLTLVAPGLIKGRPKAHIWACFIMNLYFLQGFKNLLTPQQAVFGALEIVISFTLFCCALLYARWCFQYERQLQAG